ncbi:MAG: hypothetical protein WD276_09860 [Actinomycetota bacterium]
MSERAGEMGQVLGASVTLTGWSDGRQADVAKALAEIMPSAVAPSEDSLPLLALETPSRDKAEWALDLLEAAGGAVSIARVWMAPEKGDNSRPACPSCGSKQTQPFTHAGPVARVNMKCTDCGHLFKVKSTR